MSGSGNETSVEPSGSGLQIRSARWNHVWSQLPEQSSYLYAVIAQPSYALEYVNPAGRALLGLSPDEDVSDKSLMEFVPNQGLWTLLNDAIPTAWRSGSWSGEIELRRTNGDDFAVNVMVSAQNATADFPESLVLVAHDISETKKAIANLKRDQRFLRALLENVPDMIYFKDTQSRYLRFSHAFAMKFGATNPETLIGMTDHDFFTDEHAQPALEMEQQIMRTERPLVNFEEKETFPDGRVTWASTTKLPFYNEYGQVIGTFGVTRDITARKQTETALAESQRRLMDASRMAGMAEVASGVLHNVGNAFNSVNTSATLMADQLRASRLGSLARVVQLFDEHAKDIGDFITKDSRGRQLPVFLSELSRQLTKERDMLVSELESLRRGVDHIKAVIAMQQSYAHPSSMAEDVSITELVEETLLMRASSLSKNNVEVIKEFSPVEKVRAARHRVLEILVNLLTNAEHAVVAANATKRQIRFLVSPADQRKVQLSVIDNGTGIAAENLQRIFSFGFTTKKEGHGFGLHNSALAAKEMDGALFARSEGLGTGAEFVLTLPAAELPEPN
ncbi:MAG TPA: PAS domain S-box protein [Opitutaceae bacterium]|nr:PAS domain S-box protein [Opitutaceae bacterium]